MGEFPPCPDRVSHFPVSEAFCLNDCLLVLNDTNRSTRQRGRSMAGANGTRNKCVRGSLAPGKSIQGRKRHRQLFAVLVTACGQDLNLPASPACS